MIDRQFREIKIHWQLFNPNHMKPRIFVLGSSNTDMVIKADHLPVLGETILGGKFSMSPGGKGANQAIAAARLGGRVTLISKIGTDLFGKASLALFEEEGINTSFIFTDAAQPSGVALITVDRNGNNCIVVASGANAALRPSDLSFAVEAIESSSLLLLQLETPLETLEYIADIAFKKHALVILSPSQVLRSDSALLASVSILTPARRDAELMTGMQIISLDDAEVAAGILSRSGVKTVLITLGREGVFMLEEGQSTHFNALDVKVTDTTAALGIFNGALAVGLSEGKKMYDAVGFAVRAASISLTRPGGASSAPFRTEVEAFRPEYRHL